MMTSIARCVVLMGTGFALLTAGCVPMRNQAFSATGGEADDRFQPYANYGPQQRDTIAIVQLGPSHLPKPGTIIDAASYAIAPGGQRFGISTEPYAFDLARHDARTPNIRDALYLTTASGERDGSSWKDGDWTFVLVLDTPQGRQQRQFDVSLKTSVDLWWVWQRTN